MTRHPLRHALLGAVAGILVAIAVPSVSTAQVVVYDPTNYAQNVLTAARSLQQINNQIQQLQNEAASLINEARNLASLPMSELNALQGQIDRTRQLLNEAQSLAYDVQQIDQAFEQRYRNIDLGASDQALIVDARTRWETSVGALQDSLRVQAGVVGNIPGSQASLERLVGASQSAEGALQASQAGNQMLALLSQQIADLTALLAAQSRAQALEAARDAAAEEQGREQFRRFMRRSGSTD
jgi:type IV secretion system protein TrbJ